ncbi:FecCD family ABC transporter permease [Parafrankia sp. FMc2]|uniref:FecCD family ABC transporter permease n=1 Tax=Parafrankia sp. FMc2 TaxID=3233196 RepID=UPI0034D54334
MTAASPTSTPATTTPATTTPAGGADHPSGVGGETRARGREARSAPLLTPARRTALVLLALGGMLVVSVAVCVALGPVNVPVDAQLRVIWAHLSGREPAAADARFDAIVWNLRLPRVLLGALAGAGLAVVGAVLQALLRNPLADPFILGTSYSAGVGAVTVTLAGSSIAGVYTLSAGAFTGAAAATALLFLLAGRGPEGGTARLLLAGVALSFIAQSITNLIVLIGDDSGGQAARAVLFWLMGGLGGARWTSLVVVACVLALTLPMLGLTARTLDALMMGEQTAASIGVEPGRVRVRLFLITSLMTGSLVAVCGGIGFVGLMMPLFTRLLLRTAENARVLPVCALLGAIFLVWADLLARMVIQPAELPVGLVTALVGGPLFLWMLLRRGSRGGIGFGALR